MQELSGGTPSANLLTGLGLDRTFSRTDASGTSTFLSDALGSTVALADSSGTVQTSYTYDPFGKPSSTGATSSNTQQYTGLQNDGTGLQYNRARYYSPTLQRFISEDPLGFGGGSVNLYAYAGNDPINASDPSGNCPWCAVCRCWGRGWRHHWSRYFVCGSSCGKQWRRCEGRLQGGRYRGCRRSRSRGSCSLCCYRAKVREQCSRSIECIQLNQGFDTR